MAEDYNADIDNSRRHSQYNDTFITALQWLWGDGNMAPGGTADLVDLLTGIEVRNKSILDVGSGLGAIALALVKDYHAKSVIGVDVEPHLVEHSRQRAKKAGLDNRVTFKLVTPGPLPFNDELFDIIITKDAIVHIPDKARFYQDILRILKPGGVFAGSDWLRDGQGAYSETAARWLEIVHLDFELQNQQQTSAALRQSGFEKVQMNDRNEWYKQEIKAELATLAGEKYQQLAKLIGSEAAEHRLHSSRLKQQVVEEGFLRPTHFVGFKPL